MFQIISRKLTSGSIKIILGLILTLSLVSINGHSGQTLKDFFSSFDFFIHFYKMPYNDILIALLIAFGLDDFLKYRVIHNGRRI